MQQRDGRRVNRRRFLAEGVAATAVVMAASRLAAAPGGPTVVIARDKSKQVIQGRRIDAAIVQKLVDQAVMRLAGKEDAAAAWGVYVKPKDKVAVKFNGLFRNATTHPEVVQAVVKGLLAAGVPPANIVVYDRDDRALSTAGLKPGGQVTFRGTEKQFRKTIDQCYGKETKAGPVGTRITKILLDADVLINLPIMKTHGLAGITGALKNHLGTVPNARDFHRDTCRYVADISALPAVKDKTRLCICDALYGLYHGGPQFRPQFRFDYYGVLAATDPVALDATLADIIKAKRVAEGMSPYHKDTLHIARAAELNLGTADLKSIQRVEMDV